MCPRPARRKYRTHLQTDDVHIAEKSAAPRETRRSPMTQGGKHRSSAFPPLPRSRMPIIIALSLPPVPVILRAPRLCILGVETGV
jgi:hypothetical protein